MCSPRPNDQAPGQFAGANFTAGGRELFASRSREAGDSVLVKTGRRRVCFGHGFRFEKSTASQQSRSVGDRGRDPLRQDPLRPALAALPPQDWLRPGAARPDQIQSNAAAMTGDHRRDPGCPRLESRTCEAAPPRSSVQHERNHFSLVSISYIFAGTVSK